MTNGAKVSAYLHLLDWFSKQIYDDDDDDDADRCNQTE